MKKILLSIVALMIAASSYAKEDLKIDISNISRQQVKKDAKKTDDLFSANSFAGAPVLDHKGQWVGLDVAVLIDEYDENFAVVRPLAEYNLAGVKVRSVAAVSLSPDGKQVYAGLGALVPVGKVLDGVELEVGAIAPGADLTNGFKIDGNFVPAVKAKFDFPKVFNGVKNVFNKGLKVLSPVGGQI